MRSSGNDLFIALDMSRVKIGKLKSEIGTKEQIIGLDIKVSNGVGMEVLDGFCKLFEVRSGEDFALREASFIHYVEKVPVRAEFGH
eukprot:CAMPEP_0114589712 /NCGR_PEP_ID=MMETSP0125-20121206/12103_2 /TAXON_ID=485358 ORGANISM="Aristerostoma sp., Strain ATCC 50986" /NCGR_SAMPLE_ID=MMETSP0125 /ASSEMBLY_ACC=CAM_ASM_000245 /LENGTH=85 /DNA_ID=CAMNT_0001786759 /DNA_START=499 /DNA_END=756 /DNA_ORIENTATION=-